MPDGGSYKARLGAVELQNLSDSALVDYSSRYANGSAIIHELCDRMTQRIMEREQSANLAVQILEVCK